MTVTDIALWPLRQVRGALGTLWAGVTSAGLSEILPPSIVSLLAFVADAGPRSIGFADDPFAQLSGVIVVSAAMVVASFGLLTYAAVAFALLFGPVALVRFIPFIDERWPLASRSWPLWGVDS